MIEQFYKKTGEVQRVTRISDGRGGSVVKWLSIMTCKGCLDQSGSNEYIKAMKLTPETTHLWFCSPFKLVMEDPEQQTTYFGSPFGVCTAYGNAIPVDILDTDRMLIDGRQYEITNIDDPMGMGHHLEVSLKRVNGGHVL